MSQGGGRPDWDRLERLLEAALACPEPERSAWLDRECPDPALRAELESLLAHAEPAERLFDALADSLETALPVDEGVDSTTSDSPLGQQVGRYRIDERLGSGGMGVLYRARDTRLEREVALKFLPPHLGLDPEAKRRFLVEARAAAALDHPSICTVYEIGETADERLFIAMAYYEGETLKERIARGPLPVAEAVAIAARLGHALAAAHGRGIVHRDVKPANVMLTRDGAVKLLDFGLAKVADLKITRPGVTPGTMAYMAPEQIREETADGRTDLWSLGVVLYEMLAGVRPFRGDRDRAVVNAILHQEPEPLGALRTETPESVARAVARLLRKDPAARYPTAGELLTDLVGDPAAAPAAVPSAAPRRRPGSRFARTVAAALGLAAIAWAGSLMLSWGDAHGDPAAPSAAPAQRTIAVLPFVNVGGDPENEYFSDGLTEELIAAVSRLRAVRVAARTSVFALKGDRRDVREIGRALNVGTVLEGSVRQQGDRVRVSARLVSVADGFQHWAATYERRLTDLFAIESDLARRIANALEFELTATDRVRLARKPTESPEAHLLYLRGQFFWNQRTAEGLARAVDYFQRAIAVDSQYALAYAGLANAYGPFVILGYRHPREGRERMRVAAYRAVQMDDGLAEAHVALAAYLHIYEWEPVASEREYLRAIELNPSYSHAHHWYAYFLTAQGRFDEALVQRQMAMEIDPLVLIHNSSLAKNLYYVGQRELALERYRETLELDPGWWLAYEELGLVYEADGAWDKAVPAFRQAVAHAGPTQRPKAGLARVLALAGRREEARRMVDTLVVEGTRDRSYTPQLASALYALGDTGAAFAWLEAACRQRHPDLQHAGLELGFSGLETTRRFAAVLQQTGSPLLHRTPSGRWSR